MAEPLSASLLTTREWLEQEIPFDEIPFDDEDFGTASSTRSRRGDPPFLDHWRELPQLVDAYVGRSDNSNRHLSPINPDLVATDTDVNESTAAFCFNAVLRMVRKALGLGIVVGINFPIPVSGGPDVGDDERMARLASPTQFADLVVTFGENQLFIVEIERPGLFRRNAHAEIPSLHLQEGRVGGPPIAPMLGAVQQLFGYMQKLGLKYGILSSFDLIYVAHRQGEFGETLFISDGIDRGSKRFLGVIAFMLRMGVEDRGNFKKEDPKPIHAPKGLKRQGSKDDHKRKEEVQWPLKDMWTRIKGLLQGPLPETPAELLHLAEHHFATGWSGKIVRGNYEGQSIVVKLAPVGSDRVEALMTEVSAYHMLREFWGKYVPPLVSYRTAVGGTVMYIATEEFKGYEMGMGPLSQEVVQEMFDALAAVHQCGILHGDIWRSNILVAEGQQACVRFIDFGFACFDIDDEGCKREYAELVSLVSEFGVLRC